MAKKVSDFDRTARRVVVPILATIVSACLFGCSLGASGSQETADASKGEEDAASAESRTVQVEERVYVDESELDALFISPDRFEGEYAVISGTMVGEPSISEDGGANILAYYGSEEDQRMFGAHVTKLDESFSDGDGVVVEGKVGSFIVNEDDGAKRTLPLLENATIQHSMKGSDAVNTVETVEYGISAEQNGLTVTVDKIEFAKDETRVFLTLDNSTDDAINYGSYSAKLVIDGKQVPQDLASDTLYENNDYSPLDSQVLAHTSTSGVVVFPVIEQREGFQVVIPDIFSDDYMVDFSDMSVEL